MKGPELNGQHVCKVYKDQNQFVENHCLWKIEIRGSIKDNTENTKLDYQKDVYIGLFVRTLFLQRHLIQSEPGLRGYKILYLLSEIVGCIRGITQF